LFTSIRRLTDAVNQSAQLFKTANEQLEARLRIDPGIDANLAEDPEPALEPSGNGRRRLTRT
jgi:hypothetical protein